MINRNIYFFVRNCYENQQIIKGTKYFYYSSIKYKLYRRLRRLESTINDYSQGHIVCPTIIYILVILLFLTWIIESSLDIFWKINKK